jgi:hypothetical protein
MARCAGCARILLVRSYGECTIPVDQQSAEQLDSLQGSNKCLIELDFSDADVDFLELLRRIVAEVVGCAMEGGTDEREMERK